MVCIIWVPKDLRGKILPIILIVCQQVMPQPPFRSCISLKKAASAPHHWLPKPFTPVQSAEGSEFDPRWKQTQKFKILKSITSPGTIPLSAAGNVCCGSFQRGIKGQ